MTGGPRTDRPSCLLGCPDDVLGLPGRGLKGSMAVSPVIFMRALALTFTTLALGPSLSASHSPSHFSGFYLDPHRPLPDFEKCHYSLYMSYSAFLPEETRNSSLTSPLFQRERT